MVRQMPKSVVLSLIGIFSFLFFFYMSFPYSVLKETIAGQISTSTGLNVSMEAFDTALPLGVRIKGLKVAPPGENRFLNLQEVTAHVSLLSLLALNLGLDLDIKSGKDGYFDASVAFGIFDIISGKVSLPSKVEIDAKNFALDDVVDFVLRGAASGPGTNPLVAPLLKDIGFSGKLNGKGSLKFAGGAPAQASGDLKIALSEAVLRLSAPSLGLPDQKFSTARVGIAMSNGAVQIDPSSRIAAEELDVGVNGKISLKPKIEASEPDISVAVKLGGGLKDKFGFILSAIAGGGGGDGEMNMQIKGTFAQPQVTTL